MQHPPKFCAADHWAVSRTITYGPGDPKGGTLNVHHMTRSDIATRMIGGPSLTKWIYAHGDGNGRKFASDAEYEEYVNSHGYCQRYYSGRGMFKAKHRQELGWIREHVTARLRAGDIQTYAGLVGLSDNVARLIRDMGGWDHASAWSLGVYALARAIRPDLFQEVKRNQAKMFA